MRNIDAPRADGQGSRLVAGGLGGAKDRHVCKDRVVAEHIVFAHQSAARTHKIATERLKAPVRPGAGRYSANKMEIS